MYYLVTMIMPWFLGLSVALAQVPIDRPPPGPRLGFLNASDPVNAMHPQARGLQNWWRVIRPRAGGDTWYDLMGKQHGTLTNMASGSGWSGSVRPGGEGELRFDGSDDRIVLPSTGFVANLTAWTVLAWFKSGTTAKAYIYQEHDSATNAQLVIGLNENTAGDLTVFNYDGVSTALGINATSPVPNDDRWHHVAAVQRSKSALDLYMDGVLLASDTASTLPTIPIDARTIGARDDGTAPWVGPLDDLQVYTRALTAGEIQARYRESARGEPTLLTRLFPVSIPSTPPANRGKFFQFFSPLKK